MAARRPAGPLRGWIRGGRAFLAVPALLVGYAVLCLAMVPTAARTTIDGVAAQRAIGAGRVCATASATRCVRPIVGRLDGPYSVRRTIDERWELWRDDQEVDDFTVGPRASSRLSHWRDTDVTALVYDGDVMEVRGPDATTVTTTDEGLDGTVRGLYGAVLALAGAARLLLYAVRKRRLVAGWWRRGRGPELRDWDVTLLVPPLIGVIVMGFGAPWWLAVAASLATLLAWISVIDARVADVIDRALGRMDRRLPRRGRSAGRHAADPAGRPTEPVEPS